MHKYCCFIFVMFLKIPIIRKYVTRKTIMGSMGHLHNEWMKMILWIVGDTTIATSYTLFQFLLDFQLSWILDAYRVNNHLWPSHAAIKGVAFITVLVQREFGVVPFSPNKSGCWGFLFYLMHIISPWGSVFLLMNYNCPLALWCPLGFTGGSEGKESTCSAGDLDSIPGSGRSLGGGNGNPLQYCCLENPHGQRRLS